MSLSWFRDMFRLSRQSLTTAGVVVVALALVGCSPASPGGASSDAPTSSRTSESPNPELPGHLVWGQFDGDHVNVFTAAANGNNAQQLALSPTGEPRHLSFDGKQLLLAVPADDGRVTTGVINVDGTGQRAFALPPGGLNLSCVDWSPDRTRLVCEGFSDDDPAVNGVYTVAASDGQDLVRLTQQPGVPCSYSPDGTKILFIRLNPADEEHDELFTVNVDGSGETQVLDQKVGFGCDWARDGTILTEAEGHLLLVDTGGTATPIVIPGAGKQTRGSFSPDGSHIIFSCDTGDHQADIWTMATDGTELARITSTREDEEFGDWAP